LDLTVLAGRQSDTRTEMSPSTLFFSGVFRPTKMRAARARKIRTRKSWHPRRFLRSLSGSLTTP